jgi:hypothetical protein
MNRKQLRAIASYYNQPSKLPLPSSAVVATPVTRDKYRGTYQINSRGGIIQTQWIGRTNSIAPTSAIAVSKSGNKLWGNN